MLLISKFFINLNFYSLKSFESVEDWIRQCKTILSPNINLFLIGNKIDLQEEER
jgi:GTPase SAR1 family protein